MDSEIDLYQTTDANVWAAEFCRIVGEKHPSLKADEHWMMTWFANAIMCGYDHGTGQVIKPLPDGSACFVATVGESEGDEP